MNMDSNEPVISPTPDPTPVSSAAPEKKKSNTPLIIGIVVAVVLCCCCLVGAGVFAWLWKNGDSLLNNINAYLPLLS